MTHPVGVVDGTFAGTSPHAVYTLQRNELGTAQIPALAELPAVGPHATGIGKVVANLGVPVELRSYGWQLQHGHRITSMDQRRASSHRDSIIQAMADVAGDDPVPNVSVRLLGPVSLLTDMMLPSGQRILHDPGARTDLAAVWADGLDNLVSRICAVLGAHTTVFIQEQYAKAAVEGKIRTVSGADVERALDLSEIRAMWQQAADVDATVLIDTHPKLNRTAAEVASVVAPWPQGRSDNTERWWQLLQGLIEAQTPVGLQVMAQRDPAQYAEELISQYLDWGLEPAGLEHVRFVGRFETASSISLGSGLQWLRTLVDHAAGYATTI